MFRNNFTSRNNQCQIGLGLANFIEKSINLHNYIKHVNSKNIVHD
jgi:hypothetical protein